MRWLDGIIDSMDMGLGTASLVVLEIQIKMTCHFNLIRLPKMNDDTTVWESKEQWELSYNSRGSEN